MSVTFLESATRYGVPIRVDAESVVAKIDSHHIIHKRLVDLAAVPIDDQCDVYVASGGFVPGKVTERMGGRSKENLAKIWFLPFDCDLADFLGTSKEEVYRMPQDEIEQYLPKLVAAVQAAMSACSLPISGIDYTGHGILARLKLASTDNDRIDDIQTAHKRIVARINADAAFKLVDPACTDAGTRIVRMCGSLNAKSIAHGQPPRQTRPLVTSDEYITVAQLVARAGGRARQKPPASASAGTEKELSDADANALIDAIRPFWNLGQKHMLSLAVAGMLAKAGVPESQALSIIDALSVDDTKPWDRRKSVASSYARVRAGADVRGYFALREYVPTETAAFVDGVLDAFRQANAPRIVKSERGDDRDKQETKDESAFTKSYERFITPCPDEAYYGWFGDYRALMAATTEAPDQFHLGSALTLAAAMTGRRVSNRYNSRALFPNLFTVLVGRTGTTRKDTAIDRAIDLPYCCPPTRIIQPEFGVFHNVSSAEGLVKSLKAHPSALGRITELSVVLKNAKRKGTSTIIDNLIHAFDASMPLENNSKIDPVSVSNYCLSLIAATQPGRLANEMAGEEIESGFANRWLYIFGSGKAPMAITQEVNRAEAGQLYLELCDAIRSYTEGESIDLSETAKELWQDWYLTDQASIRSDDDEDRADMRARHALLIRKVALLYAITDGAKAINDTHLHCAIAFIEWMWGEVKAVLRAWGASMDVQLEVRITQVLAGGPLPRRTLQQRVGGRKWSARDFAMTLEAMSRNQTVLIDATGMVALNVDAC